MGEPVDFNRQSSGAAKKVEHEGAAWMLSAELQVCRTPSELAPKHHFRRSHSLSKISSLMN
jgi:hypothetical protein